MTVDRSSRPLLLDGGMGRELWFRGVEIPETIWSANALLTAPDVVRDVHRDYIAAGAEVITTNPYGVVRDDLANEGIEDRFAELNLLACELAEQARRQTDRSVRIAGAFTANTPGISEPLLPIEPFRYSPTVGRDELGGPPAGAGLRRARTTALPAGARKQAGRRAAPFAPPAQAPPPLPPCRSARTLDRHPPPRHALLSHVLAP